MKEEHQPIVEALIIYVVLLTITTLIIYNLINNG